MTAMTTPGHDRTCPKTADRLVSFPNAGMTAVRSLTCQCYPHPSTIPEKGVRLWGGCRSVAHRLDIIKKTYYKTKKPTDEDYPVTRSTHLKPLLAPLTAGSANFDIHRLQARPDASAVVSFGFPPARAVSSERPDCPR